MNTVYEQYIPGGEFLLDDDKILFRHRTIIRRVIAGGFIFIRSSSAHDIAYLAKIGYLLIHDKTKYAVLNPEKIPELLLPGGKHFFKLDHLYSSGRSRLASSEDISDISKMFSEHWRNGHAVAIMIDMAE